MQFLLSEHSSLFQQANLSKPPGEITTFSTYSISNMERKMTLQGSSWHGFGRHPIFREGFSNPSIQ